MPNKTVSMNRTTLIFCLVFSIFALKAGSQDRSEPGILVFTKTAGFHHSSIPTGAAAIIKLGKENKFHVDTTSDAGIFTKKILEKYAAVVFLNTTDTANVLLNEDQKAAFQKYIESGGGFVGIHAATDAGYDWPWYTKLAGANFSSHPKQQVATIKVADPDNVSTRHLPNPWIRKDEWYNFRNLNPNVHVLLYLDEKSYEGGTNGDNHPVAWYHNFDGGRAWYTALGHTEESYSEPNFLKHILGGIQYAMGQAKH